MIVDSAVYRGGERLAVACRTQDYGELRRHAREQGGFCWVGLHAPTHDELDAVAEAFDLHPLAVEDAVKAHQRPKLERYEGSLFLVLKTLWYVDATDAVETGEVLLFVGPDFVVSVRHGSGSELAATRTSLEASQNVLSHGPSAVVYAVVDRVVDDYLAVLEELQTDVDEVEASVFSSARTDDTPRIYVLKREIAEVRRAVLPLRLPIQRMAGGEVELLDDEASPFFRDVADHLAQCAEQVDTLDALLSTAFDAQVARIQLQQNEDMRTISAGVALVAAPTLLAGIWGMNFRVMPELDQWWGYPAALLVMVGCSAGLWLWFKRSGWL